MEDRLNFFQPILPASKKFTWDELFKSKIKKKKKKNFSSTEESKTKRNPEECKVVNTYPIVMDRRDGNSALV